MTDHRCIVCIICTSILGEVNQIPTLLQRFPVDCYREEKENGFCESRTVALPSVFFPHKTFIASKFFTYIKGY